MENNLMIPSIQNSKTNSETSSETSRISIRHSVIEYRNETIEFILDPSGHQVFANWRGQKIDLGLDNIYYKEDMCRFIDQELDLITTFPKLPELQGSQLEYFNNAGYRDVRLKYKGRIIKVFPVVGIVNENVLIQEAINILNKSGLVEPLE